MPFGTASSKLRKLIMFSLVQKLGEDSCYKCKKKIEYVEDFSIEHKRPWLHVSADLFWDLDNITFSHSRCNKPDRVRTSARMQNGKLWCYSHKDFIPVSEFHKHRNKPFGYQRQCKSCKKSKRAAVV